MEGMGTFTWQDGSTFEGLYKNNRKDGFGIFKWPDGSKYEGFWKSGK